MITFKGRNFYEQNTLFSISRLSNAIEPVDNKLISVNQPRYDIGKFGYGLKLEEGATNLTPSNIQSYSFADWASGTGGSVQDGLTPWGSPYRAVIPATTNSTDLVLSGPTITLNSPAGVTYTGSIDYLVVGGSDTVSMSLRSNDAVYYGNSGGTALTKIVDLPGGWKRAYFVYAIPSGYTGVNQFSLIPRFNSNTITVYFSRPQLEQKAYPTSFTDNYRDQEILTIPVDATKFTADHFTLEMWFNPASNPSVTEGYLVSINNGVTAGRWDLKFNTSTKQIVWEYYDGTSPYSFTSSNSINMNAWNYVAWGYDRTSNTQYINLNGTKTVPGTPPVLPAFGVFSQINVSTDYNKQSSNRSNIVVDDIRLSNVARTDADIATSSAGTAPMVVDLNTTIKLSSDFPNTVYLNGNTSL